MSYLLRHGAEKEGLHMREDGYIYLNDLLEMKSLKSKRIGQAEIEYIVATNDKQRFELSEEQGVMLIRASQGHTIKTVKTEELLDRIKNPFEYNQIIHGTYREPLPLIMQHGLNRMARNHMHLAIGMPGNGVISGMRTSCEIVVDINMTKAMHGQHKIPFHISSNKVVLTEGLEDGSLPAKYFRWVLDFQAKRYLHQAPFDYICIFDFECTCTNDESVKLNAQEVIEFPVVLLNVKTRQIKSIFHTYVKPTEDPQLTDFCTELTGITQDQVDAGVDITVAMKQLHVWLGQQGVFGSEFIFMSCGDFDGNHLGREAKRKQFFVPNYLRRWINLKKAFPQSRVDASKPDYDFNDFYTIKNCKPTVRGMTDMLELLELELEGRHHSGIDDCKNLTRVV